MSRQLHPSTTHKQIENKWMEEVLFHMRNVLAFVTNTIGGFTSSMKIQKNAEAIKISHLRTSSAWRKHLAFLVPERKGSSSLFRTKTATKFYFYYTTPQNNFSRRKWAQCIVGDTKTAGSEYCASRNMTPIYQYVAFWRKINIFLKMTV